MEPELEYFNHFNESVIVFYKVSGKLAFINHVASALLTNDFIRKLSDTILADPSQTSVQIKTSNLSYSFQLSTIQFHNKDFFLAVNSDNSAHLRPIIPQKDICSHDSTAFHNAIHRLKTVNTSNLGVVYLSLNEKDKRIVNRGQIHHLLDYAKHAFSTYELYQLNPTDYVIFTIQIEQSIFQSSLNQLQSLVEGHTPFVFYGYSWCKDGTSIDFHIEIAKRHMNQRKLDYSNSKISTDSTAKNEVKKKILLIDDNETSRVIINEMFQGKYQIFEASNGLEALQFRNESIDLILLDVIMPEMNGIEFLKYINKYCIFNHVPIITISANAQIGTKQEFLNYGVLDYITKPYEQEIVLRKIENLLTYHESLKASNHSSSFDTLTNLPNMQYFYHFTEELIKNKDIGEDFTIIYFNIDKFKTFNDAFGYEEGNEFLRSVAQTIKSEFSQFIVSHFSDDHFVVLTNRDQIEEKITRIHEKIHTFQRSIVMEIKAGIYYLSVEEDSIAKACDRAKLACDTIKYIYGQDQKVFDNNLRYQLLQEKHITDSLERAIQQEYLMVYYQPIMRVFSNRICGFESLVRWNDPDLGFLSPTDFISVLEKNHLIHNLDTYVIQKTCQNIRHVIDSGDLVVPVSINLSRLDFQLCDIYQVICDTVEKYQIDKKLLHIEVTESTLNNDSSALSQTLHRFREDGFEVWLDDFGSDYSTLNTLKDYSFDVLKIDMKFFSTFDTNTKSKTIITSVVDMAKKLGLRTVAEGIETKEEYMFLKEIGCDKAQGYFFSKPAPLQIIKELRIGIETPEEKTYYDTLGKVNFLSTDPLANSKSYDNLLFDAPIAVVEVRHERFQFIFTSHSFVQTLSSLGISSLKESTKIINNPSLKYYNSFLSLATKASKSHEVESLDYIYDGFQCNLRASEIATSSNATSYFVTLLNLSSLRQAQRIDELDSYLSFLYSIYDRVDMIDLAKNTIENIYLNSTNYEAEFQGKTIPDAALEFAKNNIQEDDQERFLDFYNVDHIAQRIKSANKDYITTILRTKMRSNIYRWQVYIIIKVLINKETKYLSCVRDFDANKINIFINEKKESDT